MIPVNIMISTKKPMVSAKNKFVNEVEKVQLMKLVIARLKSNNFVQIEDDRRLLCKSYLNNALPLVEERQQQNTLERNAKNPFLF